MNAAQDILDRLNGELGARIAERQSLRASGADRETLEQNRVEICGLQRRIAHALIARYLPAHAEAA